MGMCSRRRFLQAVAAVGVAGGTAGCRGPSFVPGSAADYATWLPTPTALPHRSRYAVGSVVPAALDRRGDLLSADLQQYLRRLTTSGPQQLGIDTGSVEAVHRLGLFATVVIGGFDDVADSLADRWRTVGTASGFELFAAERHGAELAVKSDAVVLTPHVAGRPGSFLQPVLAAEDGTAERYVDSDERMSVLAEAVGDGDMVLLNEGGTVSGLPDVVATGVSWRLTDDVAKTTLGLAFPDGGAVDTAAIERQVSGNPRFDSFEGITVGQHGNVGVVTATTPTVTAEAVAPVGSLSRDHWRQPRASFSFDADVRQVTVIHDGGEPVPQSRLSVGGQGFADHPDADLTSPGPWTGETSHGGTTVAPGDTVTVGVKTTAELELRYRPLGEASSVVLASGP